MKNAVIHTMPSPQPTKSKVRVLSVSHWFSALGTFVKQQIISKSFINCVLRKGSWMTTMKMVVFFDIFGAICATVLIITFERIELENCAWAQIEVFEKWIIKNTKSILGICLKEAETWQRHHETAEMAKTAKSLIHSFFFLLWLFGSRILKLIKRI